MEVVPTTTIVLEPEQTLLEKFVKLFNISCFPDIGLTINSTELLAPVYGLHFEKYDAEFLILDSKFNVQIIATPLEKKNIIRKLRISVGEHAFSDELCTCINFLQRTRDLRYALKVLTAYVKAYKHREIIGAYLMDELLEYVTIMYKKEDGLCINCVDRRKNIEYFQTEWRIWWNVREKAFIDMIKVSINKDNVVFHKRSKPVFLQIVEGSFRYMTKKEQWMSIVKIYNECLTENLIGVKTEYNNNNVDCFATIEIYDSDNEDEDVVIVDQQQITLSDGNTIVLD